MRTARQSEQHTRPPGTVYVATRTPALPEPGVNIRVKLCHFGVKIQAKLPGWGVPVGQVDPLPAGSIPPLLASRRRRREAASQERNYL